MTTTRWSAVLLALFLSGSVSWADVRTKAAREAAEFVAKQFAKETAEIGVANLTVRLERLAAKHGDEVLAAARRIGPRAMRLVEEAGEHAPQAAKLLARYGDDAAELILKRPQGWSLFLKHGDEAAAALVKHPQVAEPLVQKFGTVGAKALTQVDAQNGRRLVMMLEGGELAAATQKEALLGVVAKHGDRAANFIWRNKGALAVGAALTAFVAHPEPFLDGAKDITAIAAQHVARPVAEVIARSVDWTSVGLAAVAVLGLWLALRGRRATPSLHQSGPVPASPPPMAASEAANPAKSH
jgi:hypothetical protein